MNRKEKREMKKEIEVFSSSNKWNRSCKFNQRHCNNCLKRYSNNYNVMKAHYLFIQFAHTIRQLLEKGLKYIKDMKMSIKEVSAAIIQTLTHKILNLTGHNKTQLKFDLK